MKPNQIFTGLVIVLVLFGAAYLFNRYAPNIAGVAKVNTAGVNTTGWKTYTYTAAGFSIQYPPSFKTSIGKGDELFLLQTKTDNREYKQIQVSVSGAPGINPSLSSWVSDQKDYAKRVEHRMLTSSRTSIGGIEAVNLGGGEEIITIHGGQLYEFSTTDPADPIMAKMLETVKFLK